MRYLSMCAVNAVVPDDPQKELVVRRPELPVVSVTRGPRHAPVQAEPPWPPPSATEL